MATAIRPQAISGVSPQVENVVMAVHPSIAAWWAGQMIGVLSDAIPLKLGSVKLSHVLIAPLLAPFAALLYFAQKVIGARYVLTNRAIQSWAAMGERMNGQAALTEIGTVDVERRAGQAFFHAGDLVIRNAAGEILLRLEGVVRPDVFRQIILEARDARIQTEASLTTIQKRRPA